MTDPGLSSRRREVVRVFLRLGLTAFGGPAAHVAIMREELALRRGWVSEREFLDFHAATSLIPGPSSTELAIHLGRARAGPLGGVLAGVAFIAPAAILVWLAALAYLRYGRAPQAIGFLGGAKPVVIAIILLAWIPLARAIVRGPKAATLAILAVALAAAGVDELLVLFVAGAIAVAADRPRPGVALAIPLPAAWMTALSAWKPLGVLALFLKIGSVCFGSGYVLLAFLRGDLVERLGWVTEAQLLDAIAIGQITPGPVFTAATFLGTIVGGHAGALAATVGIFLPAFVFVALSAGALAKLRASRRFSALLAGLNAASLALMAVTWARMAATSITGLPTLALAVAATVALALGAGSAWVLLAGGAIGAFILGG